MSQGIVTECPEIVGSIRERYPGLLHRDGNLRLGLTEKIVGDVIETWPGRENPDLLPSILIPQTLDIAETPLEIRGHGRVVLMLGRAEMLADGTMAILLKLVGELVTVAVGA